MTSLDTFLLASLLASSLTLPGCKTDGGDVTGSGTTGDGTGTTTDDGTTGTTGDAGTTGTTGDAGTGGGTDDGGSTGGGGTDGGTDGTGTGGGLDFGPCEANDPYCMEDGCPATEGEGQFLPEYDAGWCTHACETVNDCPAALGNGPVTCSEYLDAGQTKYQCYPRCTLAQDGDCPSGSVCVEFTEEAGADGLCVYAYDPNDFPP